MPRQCRCRYTPSLHNSRGVILLGLLIVLALGGIALMSAVDVWTLQKQREREEQLMFVGNEYRQAILRYYFSAPNGSPRTLPSSLKSLLEDDRFPNPVRHLRRLYPDPMTRDEEWGMVYIGDRISGVFSKSEAQPIKQAGFPSVYESFTGSASYRDWIFTFKGAGRSDAAPPLDTTRSTSGGIK
jgi:type II secretory pathway pseudopilin PulG